MRTLYHFRASPFARRARLALAHKGLEVELRDARAHPEYLEEMQRQTPFMTVPVLVEEDGRALGDSTAISHYLDRAYPDRPRLWPDAPGEALLVFETAELVDVVLNTLVATGNFFYPLHEHPAWDEVRAQNVQRAQRALDALGERVTSLGRSTVSRGGWSAADMWLYTMTAWLRFLPARAAQFPLAAQLTSLGWRLPDALAHWADSHAGRPDVTALDT